MPRFTKANPAVKPSHKGALHRDLGVPLDQKIPISKIHAAMHSKNPKVRKRANYANTMAGWSKK
jgi:hypothetical protein